MDRNPYEPPRETPVDPPSPLKSDRPKQPWTFAISELLVVVAIISTLVVLLIPAVNAARERRRPEPLPPVLSLLKPLYDHHSLLFLIATPIVVIVSLAATAALIRSVLPESIRRHFPWTKPPQEPEPPPEPIDDSRPAFFSSLAAVCGTAILLFVAWHVRADRTNRRPIVTWEGPIADYVQEAAILGWLLSALAIGLGMWSLGRFRSNLTFLAIGGIGWGFLNFAGSLLFNVAVYED